MPGVTPHATKPEAASFIPEVPAQVIVHASGRYSEDKNVWYRIGVRHGDFKWNVFKKLSQVLTLAIRLKAHEKLSLSRSGASPETSSIPSMTEIRKLFYVRNRSEKESVEEIKANMMAYFDNILSNDGYRNLRATLNFFEISGFSFKTALGKKSREGFMRKKTTLFCRFYYWKKRWFVLKDNFLMTLDKDKNSVEGVFLFDGSSSVAINGRKRLQLVNSSFTLTLKCGSAVEAQQWKKSISKKIRNVADDLGSVAENRHGSFAPRRTSLAHWFADGSGFFSSVADALDNAKEEVFITGWMISPFLYLKRKSSLHDGWILKSVLERKANEGIRIYVLIYDDLAAVVNLGEEYVKRTLESISPNITVLRHRGRVLDGNVMWTHHEKLVIIDQSIAFVSGLDLAFGRWDYHLHPLTDPYPPVSVDDTYGSNRPSYFGKPTWTGHDYTNDYAKAERNFDEPFADHLDRKTTTRMPWHDVGSVTYHECARDVARHFIQRWNFSKAKRHRHDDKYPFLLLKTNPTDDAKRDIAIHPDAAQAEIQVLRSSCHWSAGIKDTEGSIHEAYIDAIQRAEHFIYIENQFFVSIKDDELVRNKIVSTLADRIIRAKGTNFRLFVVIPLVPGIEGDFSKDEGSEQHQIISYYQYKSIVRGKGSLVKQLLAHGLSKREVKEHICFCALRTCGKQNGKMITDVLYVHSKMMVVDDKLTIIGSANINDRSMLGDRDSEVALLIEDIEFEESVMGGERFAAGKFSSHLRKRLFAEHLGLLPEDYDDEKFDFDESEVLSDVISENFYRRIWRKTASENTKVFDEVFKPIPTNRVRRFSQVEAYRSLATQDDAKKSEILRRVKGYLVKFPTKYLSDEDLKPGVFSGLKLLPAEIFT